MNPTDRHYQIIKKPVASEKATGRTFEDPQTVTLRVPRAANKVEIRLRRSRPCSTSR